MKITLQSLYLKSATAVVDWTKQALSRQESIMKCSIVKSLTQKNHGLLKWRELLHSWIIVFTYIRKKKLILMHGKNCKKDPTVDLWWREVKLKLRQLQRNLNAFLKTSLIFFLPRRVRYRSLKVETFWISLKTDLERKQCAKHAYMWPRWVI